MTETIEQSEPLGPFQQLLARALAKHALPILEKDEEQKAAESQTPKPARPRGK